MNVDYDRVEAEAPPTRRRRLLGYMLLPAIAFLLGVAAMGWLLARWDSAAHMLGVAPQSVEQPEPAAQPPPAQPAAETPPPAEAAQQASPEPQRLLIDPEITRRVGALERRLAELDVQSREAVGNADRAEGLLVAFAARRALDRGVPLGFLEALLRQRFAATQPQAVGTVITAARQPVTLQELQDGLAQVAPRLTGSGPDQGWWESLRNELSNLVTVRRKGSPSSDPAERLRRATRRLEAGQVDVALAEVMRMPGREHAREWIADARRYVAARRALDTIETAALLEPRARPPAQEPQQQSAPR